MTNPAISLIEENLKKIKEASLAIAEFEEKLEFHEDFAYSFSYSHSRTKEIIDSLVEKYEKVLQKIKPKRKKNYIRLVYCSSDSLREGING